MRAKDSLPIMAKHLNIIIAGGATGGHLFPGVAIAQAFMERDSGSRILFASVGKPFEISVISKTGFEFKKISSERIKGRSLSQKIRTILILPKGLIESVFLLKRWKPDLVIGVGSYSSCPVVIGAWLMGIKIVLHEQNIAPGITNRVLSYLAERIYVSFKDTQAGLNSKKIFFTGNPVRKEILEIAGDQKNALTVDSDSDLKQRFTILVLGGSQGAGAINKAVMDAVLNLREKDKYYFIHQTGAADEEKVKRAYASCRIKCTVKPFFNDMAQQYRISDFVICRAGATTLSELTAIGKGALFIPYPFAADNHQVLNARLLADLGAAEMIFQKDLNGQLLARRIRYYASNRDVLDRMALKAKKFGRPDAAEAIVDDCYKTLNR